MKWRKEPLSIYYILEISKDPQFKSLYKEIKNKSNSINLNLELGTYYIRVCGVDKYDKKSKYTPTRKVVIRYNKYTRIVKEGNIYLSPNEFDLYFLADQKENKSLFFLILKSGQFMDPKNSKFQLYKYNTIKIEESGKYNLYYYFLDKDQNKSKIKSKTIIIDSIAPSIQFEVEEKVVRGNTLTIQKGKELIIKARDSGSGLREILYSYDKKVFYNYENPILINRNKEFKLYVKAIDKVGNSSNLIQKNIIPLN